MPISLYSRSHYHYPNRQKLRCILPHNSNPIMPYLSFACFAYTRKPYSSSFMVAVELSLSHPPLPLAFVIALSCRGDNVVQTSVPLSDVQVL